MCVHTWCLALGVWQRLRRTWVHACLERCANQGCMLGRPATCRKAQPEGGAGLRACASWAGRQRLRQRQTMTRMTHVLTYMRTAHARA